MRPAKHWETLEVCNTGHVANMQSWRIILPGLILVASPLAALGSQPIELGGWPAFSDTSKLSATANATDGAHHSHSSHDRQR